MWYISGPVFVEFFNIHIQIIEYETTVVEPRQQHRTVHGFVIGNNLINLDYGTIKEKLKLWEGGVNLTLDTADRILTECKIPLTAFEQWAEQNGKQHIIGEE